MCQRNSEDGRRIQPTFGVTVLLKKLMGVLQSQPHTTRSCTSAAELPCKRICFLFLGVLGCSVLGMWGSAKLQTENLLQITSHRVHPDPLGSL